MSIKAKFEHLKNVVCRHPSFCALEARQRRLRALLHMCEQHEQRIFEALAQDLGKSQFEAYLTEISIVKDEIEYALKNLKKWMRPQSVSGPLALFWSQSTRNPEPLGVVLIISPWNYPFQLLMAPFVGALAAGNAVFLKPSELAPNVSKVFSELIPQYFSADEVVVVEGGVEETSELTSLPFDHIFFTGSTRVGKIIMQAAAANLVPVTLELGGKSPCLIFDTDKFDLAVKRIVWGKFLNCGQTCVAPDYILLPMGQTQAFVTSAKKWIEKFYGTQLLESQDYGKIINEQQFKRLESLIDPKKILLDMGRTQDKLKFGPVIVKASREDKVMQEEIFGPILPLVEVESFAQAMEFVRQGDKPLAAYLFTSSERFKNQFVHSVSAGGMCLNDVVVHLGNKNLPFGGVGPSGMGAYHGRYSFEIFSHFKSVMRRSFWWENSLRYFPSIGKLKILKKVLAWLS